MQLLVISLLLVFFFLSFLYLDEKAKVKAINKRKKRRKEMEAKWSAIYENKSLENKSLTWDDIKHIR